MSLYLDSNPDLFCLACDYFLVQNNNKIRSMSCEDYPISCGIMYNRKNFSHMGAIMQNLSTEKRKN